jgi:transmembrane sensor
VTSATARIVEQAIGWHIRRAELTAADWHDFVSWLEADPAHAAAFDRVVLDDALVAGVTVPKDNPHGDHPLVANNDDLPAAANRPRRWLWAVGGSAIAAGLAVLAMPTSTRVAGDPYTVQTRPGEQRAVTLADGTRIELSGGTTLQLDHQDLRVAELKGGEATFAVRHDSGKPFTVRSGALSVQDVGTVFDVARDGSRFDVQVAEGAVMFQPAREGIVLKAGKGLSAREDSGSVALRDLTADQVGSWRQGRIAFTGEPLGAVIGTIRRLSGAGIRLDPGLSAQPFTGMVRLTGEPAVDVPHFAALIGARWRKDGETWILSPADSPN